MKARIFALFLSFGIWQSSNADVVDIGDVVADLTKRGLSASGTSVGFDIDDTFFYASPGFWYGQNKYSPGRRDFADNFDFWNEMNNGLDAYSLPKCKIIEAIATHLGMGHKIFFITSRNRTAVESVTKIVKDNLKLLLSASTKTQALASLVDPLILDVIFVGNAYDGTSEQSKTAALDNNNIKLYYGDSDTDKADCNAAKDTKFIRILRSDTSIANLGKLPHITADEKVLTDSQLTLGFVEPSHLRLGIQCKTPEYYKRFISPPKNLVTCNERAPIWLLASSSALYGIGLFSSVFFLTKSWGNDQQVGLKIAGVLGVVTPLAAWTMSFVDNFIRVE